VWRSQRVLGSLYEKIYDTIRARGVPPEDESVLWACLARLKDPKTGEEEEGAAPAREGLLGWCSGGPYIGALCETVSLPLHSLKGLAAGLFVGRVGFEESGPPGGGG
jgi:hypothetical protein